MFLTRVHTLVLVSLLFALAAPAGAATRYWDGGGSGNKWSSGGNWRQLGVNDNVVPAAGDTVILDHTYVAGAYTVQNDVGGGTASLAGLTIDLTLAGAGAGNITLDLNNKVLNIDSGTANFLAQNGAGGNVVFTANSGYTINLSGNWTNNGNAFNATDGVVAMLTNSGTIGGSAIDSFFDLQVANANTITSLAKDITVANILKIKGGTFKSTVAGSFRTVTLTGTSDPLDTTAGLTVTDVKILIDPAGNATYTLAKINGPLFDMEINDTAGNGGGASTITFFSNVTFKHDLRLVAGTLDSRNKTVTIENDFIQDGGTVLLNPGTLVMNAAYDGSGDLAGSSGGVASFNKLTFGKAGQTRTVRLGRDITVNDKFDAGDVGGGGGGTTTIRSTVDGTVRTATLTNNIDPLYVAANTTFLYVHLALALTGNVTLGNINATNTVLFSSEINAPGFTITAGSSLGASLAADFTMTAGTFAAGAFTHTVGRDFVFNGGTFNASTSTFNMNGDGQVRGAATGTLTFYNLQLAALGKTTTLARSASGSTECAVVSNNLTLGPGTLRDETDGDGTVRLLTLTKNTGSPLVFTGASPTVTGDARLKFKPSTASYTISGPSPLSLGSVQIAGGSSSTITLGQALTLNGDLEFGEAGVTTGNFTMGAYSHTLARGFTWDALTGTLNTTGTSLTFTGTGSIGGANAGTLTVDGFTVNGAATDVLTLQRNLTVNAVGPFRIQRGKLTTNGLASAITVNASPGLSVGDGAGAANEAVLELVGPVTVAVASGQALTVNTSGDAVKDGKLYANSNNAGTPAITRIGGSGTVAFTIYGGTVDVSALNVSYTNGNGMDITIPNGASPNITTLNGVTFDNSTTVSLKITLVAGTYGTSGAPIEFVGDVFNGAAGGGPCPTTPNPANVSFLPAGGCGAGPAGYLRMVGSGGPRGGGDTGEANDIDCDSCCVVSCTPGATGTVVVWVPPKKWTAQAGTSDWYTSTNWLPNNAPTASEAVVIPNSTGDPDFTNGIMPVIGAGTAQALSITQLGNATLTLNSATAVLKVGGSWTAQVAEPLSPAPTAGSTIEFNGTSAQTAPNSNNYRNVTISNTTGVTLGNGLGTVTVNETLTVTGTVDWGNGTVKIEKSAAFNGAASQTAGQAARTGTVQFDEATATADITTNLGSLHAPIEFANLTVNGTTSAGDWIDALVRRTFTINSGKTFALSATASAAGQGRKLQLGGAAGVQATWDNNAGAAGFTEGDDTVEFIVPLNGPDVQGPDQSEDFYDLKVSASAATTSKAHIRAGTTTVSNSLSAATGGVFTIDPGATVVLSSANPLGVTHSFGSGTELRLESNASVAATLQIAGNNLHKMKIAGRLRSTWDETLSPLPPRPAITRRAGDTGRFKFLVTGGLSVDGLSFSYGGVTGLGDADLPAQASQPDDPYADGLIFTGSGTNNVLRNVDFTNALVTPGKAPDAANGAATSRAGAHFAVRAANASVDMGSCSFDSGGVTTVFTGTDMLTRSTAVASVVASNGPTNFSTGGTSGVRIGQILQLQAGSDAGGYMIIGINGKDPLQGANPALTNSQIRLDTDMTAVAGAPGLQYRIINCNVRAEDTDGGGNLRIITDAANISQEEDRDFDDYQNGASSQTAKTSPNATANTARIDWITKVINIVPLDEAGSVAGDSDLNAYRSGVQGTFSLTVNSANVAPYTTNPVPGGTFGYIGPRGYYLGGRKYIATGTDAPDRLVCIELADPTSRGKVQAMFEIDTAYGEVTGPPMAMILGVPAGDTDTPDTSPSTLGTPGAGPVGADRQVEDVFFGTSKGYFFRVRAQPNASSTGMTKLLLCSVLRGAGSAFPVQPSLTSDPNGSSCANKVSMCVEVTSPCIADIFNPTRLFFGGRAVGANGCDDGGGVDDTYRIYGVSMKTGNVISSTMISSNLGKPVRASFALLDALAGQTAVYAGTDGTAATGGSVWKASTATGFTVSNNFDLAGANEHFRSPLTVGIYADRVYAGNQNGRVYGLKSDDLTKIAGWPTADFNAGTAVPGGVIIGWDGSTGTNQNVFFGTAPATLGTAASFYGLNGYTQAALTGYPITLSSPRGGADNAIKALPLEGPVGASDGNYFYVGNGDGVLFYIRKAAPGTNGVFFDFGPNEKLRDIAAAFGSLYIPSASGDVFVVTPKP